jgi:hypothetical protein
MNFAKAIPPKTNMHSTRKIAMLFVDVGRFSGTCISTLSAALNFAPLPRRRGLSSKLVPVSVAKNRLPALIAILNLHKDCPRCILKGIKPPSP